MKGENAKLRNPIAARNAQKIIITIENQNYGHLKKSICKCFASHPSKCGIVPMLVVPITRWL